MDFCSEISPSPPEGFIPAAMELFHIEKETGKGYTQIASEVKELSTQREKLVAEAGDLQAKEDRARELKGEVEENEGKEQARRRDRSSHREAREAFFKDGESNLRLPGRYKADKEDEG